MSTMEAPHDSPHNDAFDLAPLLAPIAGAQAAGTWLRHDAVYSEIRKLREADDPNLPQGVWKHELKRADWAAVAERAADALATRSKDLQVAVWLTEAWLRRSGYGGFATGIRLITALCREFWDGLYPPLDPESADGRLAPLVWASEKLVLPLKGVPVTAPAGEDSAPLTWSDYERALYYDNIEKRGAAPAGSASASGIVSHPQFLISVSLTPAAFYAPLAQDITESQAALDELEETLDQLAGAENTPSFGQLRTVLETVAAFAGHVLAERVHTGEIGAAAAGFDPEERGFSPFASEPFGPPGSIASRGEAFLRLREAAEFLLRTEPHSPAPYLVLRAVSWEHMQLADLLGELLQNSSDLAALYSLLGMNREG
jgi:type VI secretion system protein ImpA